MKNIRKIVALLAAALMLFSVLPMGAFAAPGDVIVDYNFDDGSNGHFERSFNENGYIVFDATTANWQNTYAYMNLKSNTVYKVTFSAKANKDANLGFKVNDSWKSKEEGGDVVVESVAVTTEWQNYELTISIPTITSAIVMFTSGYEAGHAPIYYIDNLKIAEPMPAGGCNIDWNDGDLKFNEGEIAVGPDGSNCYKWTTPGGWSATYTVVKNMDPTKDYTITMKAKGSVAAGMGITIQNGDWGSYWNGPVFNVTTEWQDVVIALPANSIPFTAGSILFKWQDVGVAMDLYIDDLVIAEGLPEVPEVPLCANGDFETGDKTGWSGNSKLKIEAAAAHSGNYGAHLIGTGDWGGMMERTFDTEIGKKYELSLWIKANAAGSNIQVKENTWQGADIAGAGGWFNKTEWTQITYTFTATTAKTYLNFCGANTGVIEDLYVDDVTLKEIIDPSFDGYIYNGDFETGDAQKWENLQSSNTVEIVDGMESNHALKFVSGGQWTQIRQKINVTPNTNYVVSVNHKNAKGMSLLVKDGGDAGNIKQGGLSSGDDWTTSSVEFNSGSYSVISIGLMGNGAGDGGIFDNITVTELKDPSFDGYIYNGDFETGEVPSSASNPLVITGAWYSLYTANTLSLVKGYEGDYALSIVTGSQWNQVRQDKISVEPNSIYYLSAYVKNARNMGFVVKTGDDKNDLTRFEDGAFTASDEWTLVTLKIDTGITVDAKDNPINNAINSICILVISGDGDSNGEVIIDNITLEKHEHAYELTGNGEWPTCETEGWLEYACSICGDVKTETLPAYHNGGMEYNPAKEAIDCANPGNIENYFCPGCYEYFADANAQEIINPWYIQVTVDCVKPDGLADCAAWTCETCGNENFGYGEHDVLACQGGTCSKCNAEIEGYGCANYDTPACEDGVCYYCGGFVAGMGHENGSWAACCDGECSYGCGLIYPATEDHVDSDADDYCDNCWNHLACFDTDADGWCDKCWTEMPHDCIDADADGWCDKCGAEMPVTEIMYGDVNGDGSIDMIDSALVQQHVNQWTVEMNLVAADVNCDGSVDMIDSALLQQYINQWDVVLGPTTKFNDGEISRW